MICYNTIMPTQLNMEYSTITPHFCNAPNTLYLLLYTPIRNKIYHLNQQSICYNILFPNHDIM